VAGAFLLEFKHLIKTASADGLGLSFIGFAAAAITGIITIKFMLDFVRKNSYVPFVIYRVVFGIVLVASFVKW
jgi:undecaprenyl-diphosphatase